jgi:hypothetical protein
MGPVPPSSHACWRGFELRLSENFICKTWAAWAQLEVLVQTDLKYNNYILVVTKLINKVKIGWVSDCAFYPFKNTWFAFLMKVHSAQLHGPIWTPEVCNNQHYKWKICCKNQRETVKGSEQIWRKLKLMDDDWRWEEHTLIQQKFRRQIHLLLSDTSSTFPFNC